MRRTYKILVKLVRHRRLQLCNFGNSLTLSKLKEMPCYIGDLDTALRLRPSSFENHNMFIPSLCPYYSHAMGEGA